MYILGVDIKAMSKTVERKIIGIKELLSIIREQVERAGGQKAFAETSGLSSGYVNEILAEKRPPGPKMLKFLGYRRVVNYEEQ